MRHHCVINYVNIIALQFVGKRGLYGYGSYPVVYPIVFDLHPDTCSYMWPHKISNSSSTMQYIPKRMVVVYEVALSALIVKVSRDAASRTLEGNSDLVYQKSKIATVHQKPVDDRGRKWNDMRSWDRKIPNAIPRIVKARSISLSHIQNIAVGSLTCLRSSRPCGMDTLAKAASSSVEMNCYPIQIPFTSYRT